MENDNNKILRKGDKMMIGGGIAGAIAAIISCVATVLTVVGNASNQAGKP